MPATCPHRAVPASANVSRQDGSSYACKFARVILDSVDRLRD
jgi:hypothetical protein